MSRPKSNRIRASLAFLRGTDGDVHSRGDVVEKAMSTNLVFSQAPTDLAVLKTTLSSYSAAIVAALDGGRTAITNRQAIRDSVSKTLRLLAHYAEAVSNGDMTTFVLSGFEPLLINRLGPRALTVPTIRDIRQGASGELQIRIGPVIGARSYEIRYALEGAGDVPGPWIPVSVTRVRPRTSVVGLTPGGTYQFQVRALGHLGFTDWSNSFTRMSI